MSAVMGRWPLTSSLILLGETSMSAASWRALMLMGFMWGLAPMASTSGLRTPPWFAFLCVRMSADAARTVRAASFGLGLRLQR
jgi:hypothetical protein